MARETTLTPQPIFHVVNATHIEVQWDKPFTIPDIDVRKYTLSIWNTSSLSLTFPNQVFSVSEDTEYPIRYYFSNEGNISDECVYLNSVVDPWGGGWGGYSPPSFS